MEALAAAVNAVAFYKASKPRGPMPRTFVVHWTIRQGVSPYDRSEAFASPVWNEK